MILEGKETLAIWGEMIPGNSERSKLDDMNVDKNMAMEDVFFKYPGIWDKETDEIGDLRGNDFLAWHDDILEGYGEETYTDKPILIPYLVEGSDRCVILCPGGAYLNKSMDSEGEEVAQELNKAGISAFVLWYRSHPYRAPYMFLDGQRAVRYVRYHADEFGIDPHKIAIAGFSAGGNLAGVEALVFRDNPVDEAGYVADEIDAVSGAPDAVGLIYPAISLADDKAIAIVAGVDTWNDPEKRTVFGAKYDMISRVQDGDAPVFLCACMDDDVLPPLRLAELAKAYDDHGVRTELHLFPYGGHGFGACVPHVKGPFPPADYSACYQWLSLFSNWINRVFK